MSHIDDFYINQSEPNRSCLLALRSIILKQDQLVTETKKYGMPCFCYKLKMFCYLWTDKKTNEPYILFVEGDRIQHELLETGGRKRMKILRINPTQDIPKDLVESLVQQSLDLYRKGVINIT